MSSVGEGWDDVSVIGDKGEIGFIDYQDDKSVCSYNPDEEGPILVSVPFPFVDGKPQSVAVGRATSQPITIQNTTDEPVDLWAKIYASNPENSFTLSVLEPPSSDADESTCQGFLESFTLEDRMLQPGEKQTIWVSCKPEEIGLHTTVVLIDCGNDRIERAIFLLADDNISQSLAPRQPYFRSRRGRKKGFTSSVVDEYVRGSRPAKSTDRTFRNRLPRYDIPKEIRKLVEMKQVPDVIDEGLSTENYAQYFKALLIMEEIQLEEDMRAYDMEGVSMRKEGSFLCLEVPGLAERRPSLVHGDYILAKLTSGDEPDTPPYQGYIHRVEADEVNLKFAPTFHQRHRDGNVYNIKFTYNRINARRLYQAVDAAERLHPDFLFPNEFFKRRIIKTKPFVPISCNLNKEQILCIEKILGFKGAPPYVIHGPPGTGKTRTIVEAILQIYKTRRNSRILVCAPSNTAADYILEKILSEEAAEIKEHEIFRLNATTRAYEDIKPDLIRFCFFDELIFKCPPPRALIRYRIIISTYMSPSLLYAEGLKRGHFTHIFLDEAGQASEPETMVPISNFCVEDTVVVLAGDPMQLGPVIYSQEADCCGLGKSYLERLFEFDSYCSGDDNYVVKLIKNYRCHPEILDLPSIMFYSGELIACKEETTLFMDSLDFVPNKEFPVIFFGIQGCDEREGNNPSWFNRIEVSKVIEIIKKLTASRHFRDEDIGVITPYRQQVLKITEVLERLDMTGIKVGSVEQYQGQEKRVIIISTVRSTVKHNEFDRAYCLGFLSNSRRFNVAITRAISLLVIIGNPHIICKDPCWNRLLWRCVDKNSYQGCGLPEKIESFDDGHTDEYYTNDERNFPDASAECDWNQQETDWGQAEAEFRKPVTDEAEWSDGWK